jgi:hypothetical protein
MRRSGAAPDSGRAEFEERVATLSEFTHRVESMVFDNENRYLVKTVGLAGEPLTRARIAVELGLHQKAIDILIGSHPDLYGGEGIRLLIELLLQTGQAPEARVLLDREEIRRNPGALGVSLIPGRPHSGGHSWAYRFPAYPWLSFCHAASAGRYIAAATALEVLSEGFEEVEEAALPARVRDLAMALATETGLAMPLGVGIERVWIAQLKDSHADRWRETRLLGVQRADLLTLAGILELERGQPGSASRRFAEGVVLYESSRPFAPALPGLGLARRYLASIQSTDRLGAKKDER